MVMIQGESVGICQGAKTVRTSRCDIVAARTVGGYGGLGGVSSISSCQRWVLPGTEKK